MELNWRQRQKQELRQTLYETALRLFVSDGYESTTVQHITGKAGVAKGTFFNHFPSKEHVVAEWYNKITEKSLAAARKRQASSAEEAVCELFADMSGQATSSPELMLAKFQHCVNPLLMQAEKHQVDQIKQLIHQQCSDAKSSGELADDLDVDLFIGMLIAVLTGTSRAWVYTEPRFDFPSVIRERIRFLFRAARAGT